MVRLTYLRNENGASSVEYGLLATAIAGLIVVIVFAFGGLVRDTFGSSCEKLEAKVSTGASCATK